jgi:MarR family transcriptional regulator for hemolysin
VQPAGMPIGLRLARASKDVGQAFNATLAGAGGSIPVWLILNALKGGDWRSQRGLARSMGIKGPTLTRHLDGMERAGLIRRLPDPSDRRVQRIELTADGVDAHARMLTGVIAFNEQLRHGVSDAELRTLAELLDRLVANAGTL